MPPKIAALSQLFSRQVPPVCWWYKIHIRFDSSWRCSYGGVVFFNFYSRLQDPQR